MLNLMNLSIVTVIMASSIIMVIVGIAQNERDKKRINELLSRAHLPKPPKTYCGNILPEMPLGTPENDRDIIRSPLGNKWIYRWQFDKACKENTIDKLLDNLENLEIHLTGTEEWKELFYSSGSISSESVK